MTHMEQSFRRSAIICAINLDDERNILNWFHKLVFTMRGDRVVVCIDDTQSKFIKRVLIFNKCTITYT